MTPKKNNRNEVDLYQEAPIDDQSIKIINHIFMRFESFIPSMKYTHDSAVSLGNIKKEFIYELRSKNVNEMNIINVAIEKIRGSGVRFIPTPGEFINFCKQDPKSLGLPSHSDAYDEALRRSRPYTSNEKWSHAVVYNAYKITSSAALQRQGNYIEERKVKELFFSNYDLIIKSFLNDEELDSVPILIENTFDSNTEVTSAGVSALSALRKMVC